MLALPACRPQFQTIRLSANRAGLLNAQSWRLIIVWLEVRVLPTPPRSPAQTEISQFSANSPEPAGFRFFGRHVHQGANNDDLEGRTAAGLDQDKLPLSGSPSQNFGSGDGLTLCCEIDGRFASEYLIAVNCDGNRIAAGKR